MPSIRQVLTGLKGYYVKTIKDSRKDIKQDKLTDYLKGIDEVF